MQLPFTLEQFLLVFSSYNTAIWPMQIVLDLLGLAAIALCFRTAASSRIVAAILGGLWAWTGIVYHLMFFANVNPAARVFGTLCIVQAIIFLVFGVFKHEIDFRFVRDWRSITGAVFILYAMLIYPIIGYALGHVYPASPTFGAPCPTTIFTFGILLWTVGRLRWYLYILPLVWALIGFTAALKLGIREDIGLLVAGVAGTIILMTKPRMKN
jgi:hypothetical protein